MVVVAAAALLLLLVLVDRSGAGVSVERRTGWHPTLHSGKVHTRCSGARSACDMMRSASDDRVRVEVPLLAEVGGTGGKKISGLSSSVYFCKLFEAPICVFKYMFRNNRMRKHFAKFNIVSLKFASPGLMHGFVNMDRQKYMIISYNNFQLIVSFWRNKFLIEYIIVLITECH